MWKMRNTWKHGSIFLPQSCPLPGVPKWQQEFWQQNEVGGGGRREGRKWKGPPGPQHSVFSGFFSRGGDTYNSRTHSQRKAWAVAEGRAVGTAAVSEADREPGRE